MTSLVIGGTGPTGPFIVNGLLERGHEVVILHTGNHEIDEIPPEIEHIHTDPYDSEAFEAAIQGRDFDVCVANYGRLRKIAESMRNRCERFLSIGGVPAYRGYMNPELHWPAGLPVPTSEDAPLVREPGHDEKGYRIVLTEEAVLGHQPKATHFRYPYVYGPYQPMPREWCIVRRVLDGRAQMILPEDGLSLHHYGYAENLAHAVLLAVDHPEKAAGQIYNCGDEEVLSLRQVVELTAKALSANLEIVSMPWELATPSRPMVAQPLTTHRVLDISKLQRDLGYYDKVPAREAVAKTAHWLVDHRPEPGGMEETVLQDPFDYAAEDQLIEAWQRALTSMPEVEFKRPPGFTLSYSGPGGRERTKPTFEA